VEKGKSKAVGVRSTNRRKKEKEKENLFGSEKKGIAPGYAIGIMTSGESRYMVRREQGKGREKAEQGFYPKHRNGRE